MPLIECSSLSGPSGSILTSFGESACSLGAPRCVLIDYQEKYRYFHSSSIFTISGDERCHCRWRSEVRCERGWGDWRGRGQMAKLVGTLPFPCSPSQTITSSRPSRYSDHIRWYSIALAFGSHAVRALGLWDDLMASRPPPPSNAGITMPQSKSESFNRIFRC